MTHLFDVPCPESVCEARIDIKVPSASGAGRGRPIKAWSGLSNADEMEVQAVICRNELLYKIMMTRRLLSDDFNVLEGILTFFPQRRPEERHDIEVTYVPLIEPDFADRRISEILHLAGQALDIQKDAMKNISQSFASLAQHSTQAIAKIAKHSAFGIGEVSKQNSHLAKFAKRLFKDHKNLNVTLIKHLSGTNARDVSGGPFSNIESLIKAALAFKGADPSNGSGGGTKNNN
jgi:hypothetical protein